MGTDGEHVNPAVQQGLRVSRACHLTHLPGANSVVGLQDTQLNAPVGFLVKEQMLCLCEGGKGCSRENPAKQKAGNAIKGLHSNWVGDKVLAMARPWQDNISKHKLLEQFKEHNIGLIVNLQEVGVVQQVDQKRCSSGCGTDQRASNCRNSTGFPINSTMYGSWLHQVPGSSGRGRVVCQGRS